MQGNMWSSPGLKDALGTAHAMSIILQGFQQSLAIKLFASAASAAFDKRQSVICASICTADAEFLGSNRRSAVKGHQQDQARSEHGGVHISVPACQGLLLLITTSA